MYMSEHVALASSLPHKPAPTPALQEQGQSGRSECVCRDLAGVKHILPSSVSSTACLCSGRSPPHRTEPQAPSVSNGSSPPFCAISLIASPHLSNQSTHQHAPNPFAQVHRALTFAPLLAKKALLMEKRADRSSSTDPRCSRGRC